MQQLNSDPFAGKEPVQQLNNDPFATKPEPPVKNMLLEKKSSKKKTAGKKKSTTKKKTEESKEENKKNSEIDEEMIRGSRTFTYGDIEGIDPYAENTNGRIR